MSTYGQFCPVALASKLLTRRWTPLVIREILCGSTRFNEIRRGVPKMSVKTSLRAMTRVWRGDVRYEEALRRHRLTLRGPAELRRSFPEWLGYSVFATVERPA